MQGLPRPSTLNPRERQLLRYLVENAGRTLSRAELLDQVWNYRGRARTRVVDMTVRRLRAKCERRPSKPQNLRTVHGAGYRLELPPAPIPVLEDLDGSRPLPEILWSALSGATRAQICVLAVFEEHFSEDEARRLGEEPDGDWLIEVVDGLRLPRRLKARALAEVPEHARRNHALWATRQTDRVEDLVAATRWALGSGERALAEAGCSTLASLPDPPAEALLLRARVARTRGALEHAAQLSQAAVERASITGDTRIQAQALRGLAWQANLVGELERGVALHRMAEAPARAAKEPLLLARVQSDLGCALLELGRRDEARMLVASARNEVRLAGDPPRALADIHASLGLVALYDEDAPSALSHHRALLRIYEAEDDSLGVAWALNNLGESFRIAGDAAEARAHFLRAQEWFRANRAAQVLTAKANLALLDLLAGREQRALPTLRRVLADAQEQGRRARVGRTLVLLAACGDDCLHHARVHLDETGFCEPAIARVAEHAGFTDLALDQWRRLGRGREAARTRSTR